MRKHREGKLSEAIARMKQQAQSQEVPQEVLDETLRRMAEARLQVSEYQTARARICAPPSAFHPLLRFAAAAAVFVLLGYTAGRLSAPKPLDVDQLRDALAPAVADRIEPALRARLVQDMRHDYQLALASMYVRIKEELTEQYRNDSNRLALQTLAASNAVTNELLTRLIRDWDTTKAQDLRRIARVLSEIEMNRVQDRAQLASGLQTLAYCTEDEFSRTKREIAQLLVNVHPAGLGLPGVDSQPTYDERNKP